MVTTEAGQKVAQVMMVLGTDASGADHPRWKDNLAFALRLQKNLIRGYTSLARPTVLRRGRYNQHLSPGAILVEVGGHGNTLSEAIAGGRLWADSVARTLLDMKERRSGTPPFSRRRSPGNALSRFSPSGGCSWNKKTCPFRGR